MGQLRALGASFGEEEREGVGVGVLGELVEGGLEGGGRIRATFAERVQHGHEGFAGGGPAARLRREETLRAMTKGRSSRSARLFSAGMAGSRVQ